MQYHVNGEVVDRENATVSVEDRGFRYGDGAFETCRVYGGTVFEWDSHLERLQRTCETLGMPDAVPDDLVERVDETLAANGLEDAYVRVSITRGVQPGKLTPDVEVNPTVVVYCKPLPRGGVSGDDVWDTPAKLASVETRRIPDSALPADAKTHNYLNGILARLELRQQAGDDDYDEALLCDTDGYLAEGATSNLFFVDDGVLKTPSEGDLLPGITRTQVVELADELGVELEMGRYVVSALQDADEAFLTNSTWELRPVVRVDDKEIGGGPVTSQLRDAYDERIEDRCY